MKSIWLPVWMAVAIVISIEWPRLFPLLVPAGGKSPATIGDMYEALTGLSTVVGFILVLFALRLQRSDFDRRAVEIEDSRREAQVQNVRTEVFQLVNVWQDIIQNTVFTDDAKISYEGRQAFSRMSSELSSHISRQKVRPIPSRDAIAAMYAEFFQEKPAAQLGNYFRLLYNIARFVSESALKKEEKDQLLRLLRAHLSEPEFHLLFWHGLTPHAKNFHALIDEYDLLQNFSFDGVKPEEARHYPLTYRRRETQGLWVGA